MKFALSRLKVRFSLLLAECHHHPPRDSPPSPPDPCLWHAPPRPLPRPHWPGPRLPPRPRPLLQPSLATDRHHRTRRPTEHPPGPPASSNNSSSSPATAPCPPRGRWRCPRARAWPPRPACCRASWSGCRTPAGGHQSGTRSSRSPAWTGGTPTPRPQPTTSGPGW